MANRKLYFRRVLYEVPEDVVPVKDFCYGCVMPDTFPCHCDIAYNKAIKELLIKLNLYENSVIDFVPGSAGL